MIMMSLHNIVNVIYFNVTLKYIIMFVNILVYLQCLIHYLVTVYMHGEW